MQNSTDAQPPRFSVTTTAGCTALVLAGLAMIIIGLPEKTFLQRTLLQSSGFAFAAALVFGIVRMRSFQYLMHTPTRNFHNCLKGASLGLVIGITLYVISLFGLHDLAPLGLFFILIGLLILFLYVVTFDKRHDQARRSDTFEFSSDEESILDIISTKE